MERADSSVSSESESSGSKARINVLTCCLRLLFFRLKDNWFFFLSEEVLLEVISLLFDSLPPTSSAKLDFLVGGKPDEIEDEVEDEERVLSTRFIAEGHSVLRC